MTQENQITPPPVMWAQRSAHLFVTICLEDCKNPVIQIDSEKIYFKGTGGTERKEHEVTINLFGKIDPTKTVQNAKGRLFELVLTKAEEGPYWQRLTKENKKFHWLKCDFNKWKDEDDTDSENEDGSHPDLENVMRDMGGFLGSGGAGADAKPNFDDLGLNADDDEAADSDDDEMPDLE